MNDPSMMLIPDGLHNVYDYSTWNIQVYTVLTDTAGCSWMRGPGTIEGFTAIENIMEHISTVLNKDPLEIRMVNLNRKFTLLRTLIDSIVQSSDYKGNRQAIEQFNINNRWKKRGISLIPMVFGMDYFMNYHAMISIYANDGTVSVTLGGVEMGQGLNTKVAQAVAYALGIDLSMIKITTASSICAPNGGMSGASITSESCTLAALKCAEILNKRLEPIKKKLYNASWVDGIREACAEDVNLNASYMNTSQELNSYSIFGVGVSQVEIDVLTGNYQILRSDILEDAGESLSPYIDIGQVEGAFVMGLGYFLTENIKYDPDTGMVLTNRTWNYWPPGVKDIPIEWNVSLAKNLSNPNGVMRSKTTGEPPICLSYSAVTAIRDALKSARKDSGTNEWFRLDQPCSVEKILLAANVSPDQFTF
ncbi:hypothetical protein O3M35_012922 [Rhynocoris fuscipes]|uniref:Aldehyde oxidase/xanthine dehydrogenase second molybdopterin binding domain-containing protein n=1 Tax=Rhynocoris fuscipes TaxID=488301 RepID=A0AAW1CHR0_9HEMI